VRSGSFAIDGNHGRHSSRKLIAGISTLVLADDAGRTLKNGKAHLTSSLEDRLEPSRELLNLRSGGASQGDTT